MSMKTRQFADELKRFGPDRISEHQRLSVDEARAYCRKLAHRHYENFTVASWLAPKHLRQHFCNLYAYCRWADDLADETRDRVLSLELLAWWKQQLLECYRGRARHPVFIALIGTIEDFDIAPDPFLNLLTAFRQDQTTTRYETLADLLGYCRNSANPVGRLVLRLGRSDEDVENVRQADAVCTGLQLANFCQDVARDFDRGRIYLPRESWRRFQYDDAMFEQRTYNPAFRDMLRHEVDRAEQFLNEGRPLVERVSVDIQGPVDLFIRGGLAIVRAIRRANYNVWSRRPRVGKWTKLRLLFGAWRRHRRGR